MDVVYWLNKLFVKECFSLDAYAIRTEQNRCTDTTPRPFVYATLISDSDTHQSYLLFSHVSIRLMFFFAAFLYCKQCIHIIHHTRSKTNFFLLIFFSFCRLFVCFNFINILDFFFHLKKIDDLIIILVTVVKKRFFLQNMIFGILSRNLKNFNALFIWTNYSICDFLHFRYIGRECKRKLFHDFVSSDCTQKGYR